MLRDARRVRVIREGDWLAAAAVALLLLGLSILLLSVGVDWVIAGYSAKATWQHLGWSLLITAVTGRLVYRNALRVIWAVASPPPK